MMIITMQSARQQSQTPSQREVLQKTGMDDKDNDDDDNDDDNCVQSARQQCVYHPIPARGAGQDRHGRRPGEGASQPGQPAA